MPPYPQRPGSLSDGSDRFSSASSNLTADNGGGDHRLDAANLPPAPLHIFRHRHNRRVSFSDGSNDRLSSSELTADDGGDDLDAANASPITPLPVSRRRHHDQRVHVPRSTHRHSERAKSEDASRRMKLISTAADVPGFSDWRAARGDGRPQKQKCGHADGSKRRDEKSRGEASDKPPRGQQRTARRGRKYKQIYSSSFTSSSGDDTAATLHSSFSSSAGSNNKSLHSSFNSSAGSNDKHGSKVTNKTDVKRQPRLRRPSQDELGASLQSLQTFTTGTTEETRKVSNTTASHEEKVRRYREMYEAALREATEVLLAEDNAASVNWVGLGDIREENGAKGEDRHGRATERSSSRNGGNEGSDGRDEGHGGPPSKRDPKYAPKKSSSFHGVANRGSFRPEECKAKKSSSFHGGGATGIRKSSFHGGGAKIQKGSFRGADGGNDAKNSSSRDAKRNTPSGTDGNDVREGKGKVFAPKSPSSTPLEDSVIDGSDVEEVPLVDSTDSSSDDMEGQGDSLSLVTEETTALSLVTEEATVADYSVPESTERITNEEVLPRSERKDAVPHSRRDQDHQRPNHTKKKSSSFHCANANNGSFRRDEYKPKKSSSFHVSSTKKSSFRGTGTDDGNNDVTAKRDDHPTKSGASFRGAKRSSFDGNSADSGNDSSSTGNAREDKGEDLAIKRPSIMHLDDSTISGLNVEEVLLEDAAPTPSLPGVCASDGQDEGLSLVTDEATAPDHGAFEDASVEGYNEETILLGSESDQGSSDSSSRVERGPARCGLAAEVETLSFKTDGATAPDDSPCEDAIVNFKSSKTKATRIEKKLGKGHGGQGTIRYELTADVETLSFLTDGATTRDGGACEDAALGSSTEKAIVPRSEKKRQSSARGRKCHGESDRTTHLANEATDTSNRTCKDDLLKVSYEKAIVPKIMKKKETSARVSDGRGDSLPLLTNEDTAADKRAVKDAPVKEQAIVRRSRKKRGEKSESRSDHHSRRWQDAYEKRGKGSGGDLEKPPERNHGGQNHKSHRARSPHVGKHESGRGKDRSRSVGPRSGASVGSQGSDEGGSRARSRSRSLSRLKRAFGGGAKDDNSEGHAKETAKETAKGDDGAQPKQQKKGLFRKVKRLAGKVKNTLGELGGIPSVHKYRPGERARYKISRAPRYSKSYDPETMTVEVEIMTVHADAVLDMPYYTIRLPDDTCKQTNWDNLMPLSEYEKRLSAARNGGGDATESSSRRHRSVSRGSSRCRERERSSSRHDSRGRNRGDRDDDYDYDDSPDLHESFRSNTSHRSARSGSSRRSSSKGGRPQSPGPSSQREAPDGHHSSSQRRSSRSKPRELPPKTSSARTNKETPISSNHSRRHPNKNGHSSSMNSYFFDEDSKERKQRSSSNHVMNPCVLSEFEPSARSGASQRKKYVQVDNVEKK